MNSLITVLFTHIAITQMVDEANSSSVALQLPSLLFLQSVRVQISLFDETEPLISLEAIIAAQGQKMYIYISVLLTVTYFSFSSI